ncbi:MAG: cytochrome bc complex cytochrome b subunit [Calditrichaeota bacterium]|nr:MAG: cytochrome bc complex cytochrome b subunit [Calditrichota bacterium]
MFKKSAEKSYNWLDDRFKITPLVEFMRHKQVPIHKHSLWYYMGGVALFLFLVQIVSGILLLLYYQPGVDSAYESIRFITTKVSFGWLFRSVHSWSANIMVFFVFVHMFSTFFTRTYSKPRELTWLTGSVLLVLSLVFGFSGYLLPWNELAFFATKVGTDIAGAIPLIGDPIKLLLRGGEGVTGATLSRFYAFHIALIPAVFTLFLFLHLLFVQRQGMHEPEFFHKLPENKKRMMPFFPNFVLRDALLWLLVLNIIIYLAVFFPWEIGVKADAFAPAPDGIKPEWFFMFMFQALKLLPAHMFIMEGEVFGILFFTLAGLVWFTVPFWDVFIKESMRPKIMKLFGISVIAFILILTIWGYLV